VSTIENLRGLWSVVTFKDEKPTIPVTATVIIIALLAVEYFGVGEEGRPFSTLNGKILLTILGIGYLSERYLAVARDRMWPKRLQWYLSALRLPAIIALSLMIVRLVWKMFFG